jgi:aspartate kinase
MTRLVLKFGGASVATPEQFGKIAAIVAERKKDYPELTVVVSAMGDATNDLLALARKVNPNPPQRELDMLVSAGERISISLLAMALAGKGIEAVSLTGSQSGILTTADHTDARITDVRPYRIEQELAAGKVVIVAGFQGVSRDRGEPEITTLGRGGSDTTAVALALALGAAAVEFYKDVAGIYTADPKRNPEAVMHAALTHEQAFAIVEKGAQVLSPRAVRLAAENHLPLRVRPFGQPTEGTLIGRMGASRAQQPIYEGVAVC